MDLATLMPLAVKASIIAMVFTLGLRAKWIDIAYLVQRPALLVRSVAAMYLVVPIIAVILVLALDIPRLIKGTILVMAISAGAPVLPHKAIQIGANPAFVYSFTVIAAVLAIVTVPISVHLLSEIFQPEIRIDPLAVAQIITIMFLAPLFAGMVVRQFLPAFAERFSRRLSTVVMVVLVLLVVVLLAGIYRDLGEIGWLPYVAFAILTVAGLAVGHWLGGPIPGDRTALALACATRFPALALLIAAVNFPTDRPLPAIVVFLLVSNLISVPYMLWRKKKGAAAGAEPARAQATSA